MNTRLFISTACLLFASAAFGAEFNVDAVVANAAGDPGNAPAIVANAVVKHPKLLARIVSACVSALPKQTPDIVRALLKVEPERADEIVRIAIHAQPNLAVKITQAAVDVLPDMTPELIKTAINAAPEELRDSIAAIAEGNGGTDNNNAPGRGSVGNGGTSSPTYFPEQPINPDLVSPSS